MREALSAKKGCLPRSLNAASSESAPASLEGRSESASAEEEEEEEGRLERVVGGSEESRTKLGLERVKIS